MSYAPVVLEVFGLPAPQGSKTARVLPNGRAIVTEGSSTAGRRALRQWEAVIERAAKRYLEEHPGAGPMGGPLSITIAFRLPPTKSDPYRTRHWVKPDGDKLTRAVFDALTRSGIVTDDACFWRQSSTKQYALTGVFGAKITVTSDQDLEDQDRASLKEAAKIARRST